MSLPDVRYPDGTERHRIRRCREFGLFAGVRPIEAAPNTRVPLAAPRA